jgi:hypothetical protein
MSGPRKYLFRALGLILITYLIFLSHKVEGDFQLDIDYKPSPHCLAPPAGYYSIKTGQPDQPKASSTAVSNT